MRAVENLCAGKKIITNNPRILAEPFHAPDRVLIPDRVLPDRALIVDGADFGAVPAFLDRALTDPDARFAALHIQSFLRQLLGEAA